MSTKAKTNTEWPWTYYEDVAAALAAEKKLKQHYYDALYDILGADPFDTKGIARHALKNVS